LLEETGGPSGVQQKLLRMRELCARSHYLIVLRRTVSVGE